MKVFVVVDIFGSGNVFLSGSARSAAQCPVDGREMTLIDDI